MTYSDILFQLQQDCVDLINSEAIFQYNAGVAYRKAVISQEIARRVPHLTAKNGRMGCSILVMQPMVEGADPNISTPQGDVLLPFHIIEQPEINMAAGGTQISSEQIAMEIRAYFHQRSFRGQIVLLQDNRAIEPLPGIEREYQGCVGYQVMMRGRLADQSYPQVATPQMSEGNGAVITLTCATSGAAIYYTIDGSYPGPGNSTGVATLYTVPFTAHPPVTLAFAAYVAGSRGSDVMQSTINS